LKILITGGKSALALKVLKAFAEHEVILADYGEMPSFSAGNYKFISLGEKNDDTLAHSLLNACLDQEVDVFLPIHEFEIKPVAKAQILFNEFNISVLLPNQDVLESYVKPRSLAKDAEWLVFMEGEILFATSIDSELISFGRKTQLNGVFYFIKAEAVANLRLFTI
jgi:hypothetical protein